MSEVLIEVDNVGKRFFKRADKHRDYAVWDLLRDVFRGEKANASLRSDEFWAVRGVDFQVARGDAVAVIGRNGAGKSTLLRMVAGLLQPDIGTVTVRGRVQALIALGTGFSNELSGRENVINSAIIQGMNRRHISKLFDSIVDFAELEDFIDSPVGTYSSGMRARLGFSLAVHMDPEVLLIDEILGVGDIAFQNKCQVRMRQMQANGVTLLLVSHSNSAVTQMCSTAVWLHNGSVKGLGESTEVVEQYVAFLDALDAQKRIRDEQRRLDKSRVPLKSSIEQTVYGFFMKNAEELDDYECQIVGGTGLGGDEFEMHDAIELHVRFALRHKPENLKVGVIFFHEDGTRVAVMTTAETDVLRSVGEGAVSLRFRVDDLCLRAGNYVVVTPIQDGQSFLWRNVAGRFTVRGDREPSLGRVHLAHHVIVDSGD